MIPRHLPALYRLDLIIRSEITKVANKVKKQETKNGVPCMSEELHFSIKPESLHL